MEKYTRGTWLNVKNQRQGFVVIAPGLPDELERRYRLAKGAKELVPLARIDGVIGLSPEDEANGRLMASAPDLVDMCSSAIEDLKPILDDPEMTLENARDIVRGTLFSLGRSVEDATGQKVYSDPEREAAVARLGIPRLQREG